jgi:type IV pilus assembly protein PilC
MAVIAAVMFVYVVPTITGTFADLNVKLPLSTRIVIGISSLFQHHFLLIFITLVALVVFSGMFFRSKAGMRTMDWTILRIPIIKNIAKEATVARIARTFSSLLKAGVDMVTAAQITVDVTQNSYYKEALKKTQTSIEKGEPLAESFLAYEDLYPSFIGEMVSVGEETGKLSDMLMEVAVFYEDEVEQKTKDMSVVIEPFMMIIIGVAVGFFAVAMISPTYSLIDTL